MESRTDRADRADRADNADKLDTSRAGPVTDDVRELLFGDLWEYAPAPDSTPVSLQARYGHFVGGKFVESGSHAATVNPATEKRLADVAVADRRLVGRAVRAARNAFEQHWNPLPGIERGKWLYRIGRLLQDRARELARIQTLNGGQPIRDSRDVDLPLAVAHCLYLAGWADKLGHVAPAARTRPWGVVAAIVPGPATLLEAMRKIAPALAAGNTVVLTPSPSAPLAALQLAEILQEANLPPGVVNVVTGGSEIAAQVAGHAGTNLVACSGRREEGLALRQVLTGSGKPLVFEPDSPALNLVFQDAALDAAVEGVVASMRRAHGPGGRLLVQESVHDAVVDRLTWRLATLRVGDPLDLNTDVGAIPTREQRDRVLAWVAAGKAEGAIEHQASGRLPSRGYFLPPTILTQVTENHGVVRQEIHGPVLTVLTFRTPAEAIAMANGMAGVTGVGVWSDKGARVLEVGRGLRTGVVWSNTVPRSDPASPADATWAGGGSPTGGRQGLRPYLEVVS